MNTLTKVTVMPSLPKRIERLQDLAYNLYWSWTPRAQELYQELNPEIWERYHNNPVRTLIEVSQKDLQAVLKNPDYLERYDQVIKDFDAYIKQKKTWYSKQKQKLSGKIAYFSAEFAYAESLPIYSGGLGVLAGDHCKSASDLGLPFVGVGLLYHQGYFTQLLDKDGWQQERYDEQNLSTLPIELARKDGRELRVHVDILGRDVQSRVWILQVGRIKVYLMDTNVPENSPEDRNLTARLYGGNQEMRIAQEMILGIGGVRALRALNENIAIWHMNEGHAAFLGIERVREFEQQLGLSFREAVELAAASTLFTTHTPVPAGNDAFPMDLIDRYLGSWYHTLNVSREEFQELARHDQPWGPTFSMTVLALKLSRAANGVSALHGEVSRKMWNFLYPGAHHTEVPIGHVTNGAHTLTFLAQELRDLFDQHLPEDWKERVHEKDLWNDLDKIPDAEFTQALHNLKKKMAKFVRERLKRQYLRHGASAARVASAEKVLDTHTLTIGFARRFATYKRATLLFRDLERLKRIVNNPERPVQFVFAGKAHPADNPGKEFIQQIYRYAQDPELQGKIVIMENYDMEVARHLVQGVDVWLNNPRRPLEASGTSGMKASFNGSPNLSILDGWWVEGHDPVNTNGWAIGEEREYENLDVQDDADAYSLYDLLENHIVPAYYERDDSKLRHKWMSIARAAIKSVAPQFSMARQVIDYTKQYYQTLDARAQSISKEDLKAVRHIAGWKNWVRQQWSRLHVEAFSELPEHAKPGDAVKVYVRVQTAGIDPNTLRVEGVIRRQSDDVRTFGVLTLQSSQDGWAEYAGEVALPESGTFEVGARVIPYISDLSTPLELGLIRWA